MCQWYEALLHVLAPGRQRVASNSSHECAVAEHSVSCDSEALCTVPFHRPLSSDCKPPDVPAVHGVQANGKKKRKAGGEADGAGEAVAPAEVLRVESYAPADPGPYPEDLPPQNPVRFTPVQVEAVKSGAQPGLTLVVGPPGAPPPPAPPPHAPCARCTRLSCLMTPPAGRQCGLC